MIHKSVGFDVGEEVLYAEERYVVASYHAERVAPYRLLATDARGAKMVWVCETDIQPIASYTTPRLDTGSPEDMQVDSL